MKIVSFVEKNYRVIMIAIVLLIVLPILKQIFFSELLFSERIKWSLLGLLFAFLGFVAMYIVLGFQILLRVASTQLLNRACNFFIFMSLLTIVLSYFGYFSFINEQEEATTLAFSNVLVGTLISAYKIKTKYVVKSSKM